MDVLKTRPWFMLVILSFIVTNVSSAEFSSGVELQSLKLTNHSGSLDFERIYQKGWYHLAGKFGPVDYNLAYRYFAEAAKGGHLKAQANLGAMYELGLGVPRNYEAAFKWYRDAAMGGLAEAQYNLGTLYYHGLGVDSSNQLAVIWFRKAAEQQHAKSELMLAAAYFLGIGIKRNTPDALYWAKRSSRHHLAEASYAMALAYKRGIGVEQSDELAIQKLYLAGNAYLQRASRIKALEMLNQIREITPTHPLYSQLKSALNLRTLQKGAPQGRKSVNTKLPD